MDLSSGFSVVPSSPDDGAGVVELYRAAAAEPGGLARSADEITDDYVSAFLAKSLRGGVGLVARALPSQAIVGEIHACPLGPAVFAHVLGDLTIAVHPRWQGRGVGRALFEALLREVVVARPHVSRVELFVRSSNRRAIAFYESLGFVLEGRLRVRVRGVDGGLEDDLVMGWLRASGPRPVESTGSSRPTGLDPRSR